MATFKFTGGVSRFKRKLVGGMIKNGSAKSSRRRGSSRSETVGQGPEVRGPLLGFHGSTFRHRLYLSDEFFRGLSFGCLKLAARV